MLLAMELILHSFSFLTWRAWWNWNWITTVTYFRGTRSKLSWKSILWSNSLKIPLEYQILISWNIVQKITPLKLIQNLSIGEIVNKLCSHSSIQLSSNLRSHLFGNVHFFSIKRVHEGVHFYSPANHTNSKNYTILWTLDHSFVFFLKRERVIHKFNHFLYINKRFCFFKSLYFKNNTLSGDSKFAFQYPNT